MTIPTIEPVLPEEPHLPPARKRRQQRTITPDSTREERLEFLHEVSHRVTPSIDFYLFSLLAAAILTAAILLDSPALYALVVLLAPFMAPVIGMSLAVSMGSLRLFLRSLVITIIGGVIFFLSGLTAGIIAHRFEMGPFEQVADHNVFSWPDLAVLTVGAVLTSLLLVRSRQRPLVASVALAYELYLPLGMAGFGLTSGFAGLFPDGLLVFGVHIIWAVLIGAITLAIAGFRPRKVFGYVILILLILAGLLSIVFITGLGASFILPPAQTTEAPEPTSLVLVESPIATETSIEPVSTPDLSTPTAADAQPTSAASPTRTLEPSPTATITLTVQPTPVWAKVNAEGGDGGIVRANPGFKELVITTIQNGGIVQVLSAATPKDGFYWVQVRTEKGLEGWMVQYLLVTATPAPGW